MNRKSVMLATVMLFAVALLTAPTTRDKPETTVSATVTAAEEEDPSTPLRCAQDDNAGRNAGDGVPYTRRAEGCIDW